ncbi:MarR family winged helix-turn-helix transcriptional regulator [Gordonia aichiensis]|uniref:MarR family winged helix-turn-helix transcriptional regulator n=1 Tax=Gordonia aichiensis TaxID=36820 RepID=UPI00058DCC7A
MNTDKTADTDRPLDPDLSDDPISALENGFADLMRQGRIRLRTRARAIDPHLDPSNYPLIAMLAHADGPLPVSTLVSQLGLEKSTVSRQIDAIVRLGLAQRRADPHDARARQVSLTPAGRQRVERVTAAAVADWRARLSEWDPDEIRTLTLLLNRLLVDDAEFDTDPD